MIIDGNTNVAKLLDQYPELLDTFIKVSPHFKKLENKFLRKTIARRVSVSDAAKVGGVDVDHLIEALNSRIHGEIPPEHSQENVDSTVDLEENYIGNFEYTADEIQTILDVREDIASNRDPLSKIMRSASEIGLGKILVVINDFEPIPLYDVLGKKGFVHRTETQGESFHVLFKRVVSPKEIRSERHENGPRDIAADGDETVLEIDVRGLEPPEPMMRILKTLNTIDDNTILLVHHHREPMFLYDKLEERGFEAITNKLDEHHYKIVIRRKGTK
jgi:uncharacterized protein (DUF2249 family)